MSDLTDGARQTISEIANRYGLSQQAVEQMARAVSAGGGSMAQFNIQELGGGGQWMSGGMTMVGDMFNQGLQATVSNLCGELSNAMANGPFFKRTQTIAGSAWWPEELGQASSVGGQNQTRYAYFPQAKRIAFDPGNGQAVILLDTLDHQIGGFSQQQSGPGDPFVGITFSSQRGQFALSSLPRVSGSGAGTAAVGSNGSSASSSGAAPNQQQSQNRGGGQQQFQGGGQQQGQGGGQQQGQGGSQQQSQGWQPQQNFGSQQQNQGGQPQQNFGSQQQSQGWQPQQSQNQSPPARSEEQQPQSAPDQATAPPASSNSGAPSTGSAMDIMAVLERLAALRDGGAISEGDYDKKKVELLSRL